jgi:hypothetical protein
MRCLVVLTLLGLTTSAWASSDEAFDKMKESAEKFDGNLSSFLEKYVGECKDPETARECKQTAADFRKKVTGKKFYFIIGEEQSNLSPGRSSSDGAFTLNLTPFFAAGNYALSNAAPTKTDPRGNPLFPWVVLKGKAADGMEAQRSLREVANHSVRAEVIFTPQSIWTLGGKGGAAKQFGVKASFNGIRAASSMTGQSLAVEVR